MPGRVNPVVLLGIIIVAVLSFGLSAGAAPGEGTIPENIPEKISTPNGGAAPDGGAVPNGGIAPTTVGNAPGGAAPVENTAPSNNAAQDKNDATPAVQEDVPKEDGTEENTSPDEDTEQEEPPVREDAESDTLGEAEIGEVAEDAGEEFEELLDEAGAAKGAYDSALLEENRLTGEIVETRNDIAETEANREEAQRRLEERASQIYMNGQDDFLGALLGIGNMRDFKDLLGHWMRMLEQEHDEVQEWRESSARLEQNKQELEAELEDWEQIRRDAAAGKEESETRVNEAQEFFEAQDEEVQQKIEEDRAREAELALDHIGKLLQDATHEETSAGEEEESDETAGEEQDLPAEEGSNETTGEEQAIQAEEGESDEAGKGEQIRLVEDGGTEETERAREVEVAHALTETIQEWKAQRKPLADAVEETAKEPNAGTTTGEGPAGTLPQNRAAEQLAAAAEEQAKAQDQARQATEQVAAEKAAKEEAAAKAEEAEKAKLAVELAPPAEQEAARTAAEEAARNATLAAEQAAGKKQAAEEAAQQAIEKQNFAVELQEAAAQEAAEKGMLNPNLGTSGGGVLGEAKTWLGVPYDYSHSAGMTRKAVDCSAFTAAVYQKFGITLPDSPAGQLGMGKPVTGPAKAGDLVFFSEDHSGTPTHVGIANGDGTTTHASSFTGEVSVTPMKYLNGYLGARRLL